jgi:hypothetical protein
MYHGFTSSTQTCGPTPTGEPIAKTVAKQALKATVLEDQLPWIVSNLKAIGMGLVLQTLNFATWGVGGGAPKKGLYPFTPLKTFVLLY